MKRENNERKKLTINKLTIRNLDSQVNVLEKSEQIDVKAGSENYPTGITKHPIYCSPTIN